jgi:hypothetical protein
VQTAKFDRLTRQIRQRRTVDVSRRSGVCGTFGQPMLYVPLSGGRVLTVSALCGLAQKFAAKAVRQLPA